MLQTLAQDLRYALRTLWRAPGFALTAILVTALGIGANTAAFSVADFVLVQPLAFPDPDSLIRLCAGPVTGGGWGCNNQLSPANYRDFKEQTKSLKSLGAFRRDAVNLSGNGEPRRLATAVVTTDVLPLLGIRPVLGRVFEAGNGGTDSRSLVISYGLWQSQLGGVSNVVGSVLNLDGVSHEVIGVMPASFRFPTRDVQMWTLLQLTEKDYEDRGNNYLEAVGRLADGVSFEGARADLEVVAARLRTIRGNEENGISFFRMSDEFSPRFRVMLEALVGASLCILLLTCANLGNLLLARATARERELTIRVAIGARSARLVGQLVTESLTLAAIGGVTGLLLTLIFFPLLTLMIPETLPIGGAPVLNFRVLGLTTLFTALTGLAFGIIPAVSASRRATNGTLRSRWGSGRQLSRSVLVAVEVAASVVLLVSGGLLLRAMLRVQAVDPGFRPDDVLMVRTVLPKPRYPTIEKREQFYQRVLTQIRSVSGVQRAAYTNGLPMLVTGLITRVVLPGQEVRSEENYNVSRRFVTPQFFDAMGIPLLRGRDLEEADTQQQRRVAVVSESFVQRYWPGKDGVGNTFLYQNDPRTVVGVVRDIKVRGLERVSEPQMYLPTSDTPDTALTNFDPKDLVIRANLSETTLLPIVRQIVQRIDPDQPISNVMTGAELVETQTSPRRAQVRVLVALAAVALFVAGIGIYGTLAYAVAQRGHEIGLRLALGAEPSRIARRIVLDGVAIVAAGLIPGLFAAGWAGQYLSSLLFGVPPSDPATIIVTVVVCVTVALCGAVLPAARAVRVNPMSVLRSD